MQQNDSLQPIKWEDNQLLLLDQRILPGKYEYIQCHDVKQTAHAITDMVVRGAPAIGITAAYGVVLAARDRYAESSRDWATLINDDLDLLANSRPTAVNLFWAIDRMRQRITQLVSASSVSADPVDELLAEARAIHEEDIAANQRMGQLGADLIEPGSSVLTHCNAGALATGGYGTALGVIRSAYANNKLDTVYADETRPWLQGARLTAWELLQDKIPVTLIAEGAAAYLMQQGKLQWIIVGSDRIAANGDVANKIGTYSLAVAARHHGVKFMVAAPSSTVDMSVASGKDIPIEQRAADELLNLNSQRVAADGATAWNPVFDVTPAELVDAIVTERGVVLEPNQEKISAMMENT